MKKNTIRRMTAAMLALAVTVQSSGLADVVQAQNMLVRTQSETQMSSDKEAVYVNTYHSAEREQDFDANWKFYMGDASGAEAKAYDDSSWENVNLPHDYSIEQEYSKTGEAESAYLLGGTGWYRKHFNLTSDMAGKELRIDFDGVYMNATVWVNGTKLGTHPYGYTAFSFDITDYVKIGQENVITVKVDHQTPSSRWYSGSGIYRDVKLTVMDKVHVALDGTQVLVNDADLQGNRASVPVTVKTNVTNAGDAAADVTVTHTIYEKGTKNSIGSVTTEAASVAAGATQEITATVTAQNPKLWGIGEENAHLYTVTTQVKVGETVADTYDTEYGFRYTAYDTNTGFSLNGEQVKLKGVCMHHDQGSLGAEAWYRAMERQVEILQEMGCNSIRVTHNPAASSLIDICNEKGILVIEEIFDGWMHAKNGNGYDYSVWFQKAIESGNQILGAKDNMTWAEFDLKAVINRDKNDPSIIMWSLGNEIQEGAGGSGYAAMADNLIAWAQEADTTKKLTIGSNAVKNNVNNANNDHIQIGNKLTAVGGTSGTNYSGGASYDALHDKYPNWYLYGSETASHINSRGVYYKTSGNSNQELTSYDNSAVGWGATASSAWYDVITRDFVFGEYVWTGFDYLGEPTPWNGTGAGLAGGSTWPSPKNSYFGIVDTAGLPKDNYYFYMSQWNQDVTTLHVLPAWNQDVVVSGEVPIVVYSNAAAVELFFTGANGQRTSLGKKTFTEKETGAGFTYQIYEGSDKASAEDKNLYLTWYKAFEAGTIEAVAYDKAGNVISDTVGRSTVKTTGDEAKLQASADRTEIKADGKDLTYITVDVTDANGNIVPDAKNNVKFTVSGDGVLVGVDNGDQDDHQSYQDNNRNAYNGSLVAIVQSTKTAGSFTVTAQSAGLTSASVNVTTTSVGSETEEASVDYFYMSKNYYVKQGSTVTLPDTVETWYTDGSSKELSVVWDAFTETTGTFMVNGVVDGSYPLSVTVNVIDDVAALLNYSTTTPLGQAPVLATSRPAVMADGTVLDVSFPVTWGEIDPSAYAQAGTFTVYGVSNVLGKVIEVTATVRVQSETITLTGNVDDPHSLTQSVPEGQQSDNLAAVWDGEKALITADSPNPNVWTNYAYSQTGKTTSDITFEYATQQRIGEIVVHFFKDSWSARYPDAGKTKIMISETGQDGTWTEIEANEAIGEETGAVKGCGVKAYTYTFAPVTATFVKFCFTNAVTETGTSAKACTGITEIEIKKAVGSYDTKSGTALSAMTVNGIELTDEELAKDSYYTLESLAIVEAESEEDNAAITVLPANDGESCVIIESEDHKTTRVMRIGLEQITPPQADDSSQDYRGTVSVHADYEENDAHKAANVLDGDATTIWHTPWTWSNANPQPSWYGTSDCEQGLWIEFTFDEEVTASAIRYLTRGGNARNGDITGYRIQGKASADSNWETLTTGSWAPTTQEWLIAKFKPTTVVALRLVATSTYGDNNGNNKYASAAELRVVGTGSGNTGSEEEAEPTYYPNEDITPTAGSTHSSSALTSAIDGNTSSFWESDYSLSSTEERKANCWYQLELKEETMIDQFGYYPRYGTIASGGQNGFVQKYKLEVSTDGTTWDSVSTNEEGDNLTITDGWIDFSFDAVAAKYIRFTGLATANGVTNGFNAANDMCIAELRVRIDADSIEPEEPETADKTALEEKIDTAEGKSESAYTADSWEILSAVLAFANETFADEAATQEQVDARTAFMEAAIAQLVEKADTTELEAVLETVRGLKETAYTPKSWDALSKMLDIADAVSGNESQNAINVIAYAITSAKASLQERADHTALNALIDQAKKLQSGDYTEYSWSLFDTALKSAVVTANDANATAEELQNALDALQTAMNELEKAEVTPPNGGGNQPSDKPDNTPKPEEKPEIPAGELVEGSQGGDSDTPIKEWKEGDGKLTFTGAFRKHEIEYVYVEGINKPLTLNVDYVIVENGSGLAKAFSRAAADAGVTIKLTESYLATLEKGKNYTLCVVMTKEYAEENETSVFSANFAVAAAEPSDTPQNPSTDNDSNGANGSNGNGGNQGGSNAGNGTNTGTGAGSSGGSGSSSAKAYTVLNEAGSYNLNQGGTYSLRIDAEHSKFQSVSVDGSKLAESSYEHWSGSTWIRFTENYMKTLSLGDHKIEVKFTDGTVVTKVKVVSYDVPTELIIGQNVTSDSVSTGDTSDTMLWSGLIAACGVTLFGIRLKKREEDDELII